MAVIKTQAVSVRVEPRIKAALQSAAGPGPQQAHQASFRQESITISPPQFIKIRQLFNTVGVACQPKECSLQHWISRAQSNCSSPNVVYVPLPKRTLNNVEELKTWLNEVEHLLSAKLLAGPVAL